MADEIDLPDVNVWLAFSFADHDHHERARRYWYEESGSSLAFCRLTALGFLRLATNAAVTNGQPLSMLQAWQAYRSFRDLPDVVLADEPEECEPLLGLWVRENGLTPRQWTDAYLAAFSKTSGFRLVSFDRDFTRFDGLNFLRLEA